MSRYKRVSRKKMLLRVIIVLIIIVLLLFLAKFAGNMAQRIKNKHLQQSGDLTAGDDALYGDERQIITVNGKWYQYKKNIESFLIMGIDKDEQSEAIGNINRSQADFIAVTVVEHDSRKYSTIAINRDTMTKIPILGINGKFIEWQTRQLALAHTYGNGLNDSCENAKWAVSELLYQVPIAHYASFSMPAVGVLNDSVGGVTVTINDDFSGVDPTLEMGKTITLNADQAMHFTRSRMGMGEPTNINRMSRQKTFLTAFKDKATAKMRSDGGFALQMLVTLSEYMVSDMTIEKMSNFANQLVDYQDMGQIDIRGESVVGDEFMEFYIDENDLRNIVLSLFFDEVDPPSNN